MLQKQLAHPLSLVTLNAKSKHKKQALSCDICPQKLDRTLFFIIPVCNDRTLQIIISGASKHDKVATLLFQLAQTMIQTIEFLPVRTKGTLLIYDYVHHYKMCLPSATYQVSSIQNSNSQQPFSTIFKASMKGNHATNNQQIIELHAIECGTELVKQGAQAMIAESLKLWEPIYHQQVKQMKHDVFPYGKDLQASLCMYDCKQNLPVQVMVFEGFFAFENKCFVVRVQNSLQFLQTREDFYQECMIMLASLIFSEKLVHSSLSYGMLIVML